MAGGTLSCLGNTAFLQSLYFSSVTFPTLGANASGTNTLSVPGVLSGDILLCNLIGPPAHIFVENAYVSAPGVVTFTWGTDGTGVTGSTVPMLMAVARPANASLGLSALPSSVQ